MYLSFDASVKISKDGSWHSTKPNKQGVKRSGKNGISGIAHYLARAEDMKDGIMRDYTDENHECLDLDMTPENETMIKRDGQWVRCEHSHEIEDVIQERIAWVDSHTDRVTKSNGCVVRSVVVQFEDEDDPELWDAAVEHLEQVFGVDNIVCASIHRDESAPHMHVLVTPVALAYESRMVQVLNRAGEPVTDKDGKPKMRQVRGDAKTDAEGNPLYCFDQKQWFVGPASLKAMHKAFRQAMVDKGYDVEMENKPIEEQVATWTDSEGKEHRQGLTPDTLAEIERNRQEMHDATNEGIRAQNKAARRQRELDKQAEEQRIRQAEQDRREKEQQRTAQDMEEQARTLRDREYAVRRRENDVSARERDLKARRDVIAAEGVKIRQAARMDADGIVRAAQGRAAALVKDAETQAGQIRQRARVEGHELAKNDRMRAQAADQVVSRLSPGRDIGQLPEY